MLSDSCPTSNLHRRESGESFRRKDRICRWPIGSVESRGVQVMAYYRLGSILLLSLLVRPGVGDARLAAQETTKPEGQGGEQPRPDQDAARRLEQYKRAAGRYTIERHSDPSATLSLKAEPVFRWNSPLRTAYDGVLFIWTADGRPEAAATFYRNIRDGAPYEQHEFQSLAAAGLTASYAGREVWGARDAGVTPEPIPGAPRPATTPAARLRQMRALAEEFRAEVTDRKGTSPLRLLTQPLYRYEASRADLVDGALFAFVHATDPEVLLLIEARPVDGSPVWYYGLARMSGFPLRAFYKDRPVWEVRSINSSYKNMPAPEQPR
jgi:hypothetical protein